MTDLKLVPVEPTVEMLVAGKYALEAGCHASGIYADMIAAAPAVQREPAGRVKTVGGYPDDSEHTVEWLCKHKDLKDGDLLYTATQPAADVSALVEALEEMIGVAERVDSWESFPSDPIERAEDAIRAYRKQGGDL